MQDFPSTLNNILLSPVEKFDMGLGECVFTNAPMLVRTVLGSCVCVTFYHPQTKCAGAFHAVMPEVDIKNASKFCRFVDTAISSVVFRFVERDIPFEDIVVKLFGGSNKFSNGQPTRTQKLLDVGLKNVAAAKAHLRNYGFRLRVQDVRGDVGRTLYFHTGTGDVWIKKHKPSAPTHLTSICEEKAFQPLPLKNGECRYVDLR